MYSDVDFSSFFLFSCCYEQRFGHNPSKCFLELAWSKSMNYWHLFKNNFYRLYLLEYFKILIIKAKLIRKYREFSYSLLHTHSFPPLSAWYQRVHFLQSMNLHWYIIDTPQVHKVHKGSSWVVHSIGLDKYIMTCIHHDRIIQSSFTALKILCAPAIHPSSPILSSWQFHSFAFSWMSESWNYAVCSLFRLASFT